MEKADVVGRSLKSKEKLEVFNFQGNIGSLGAIGGSGHTITISGAARVEKKTQTSPKTGTSVMIFFKNTLLMETSLWL